MSLSSGWGGPGEALSVFQVQSLFSLESRAVSEHGRGPDPLQMNEVWPHVFPDWEPLSYPLSGLPFPLVS